MTTPMQRYFAAHEELARSSWALQLARADVACASSADHEDMWKKWGRAWDIHHAALEAWTKARHEWDGYEAWCEAQKELEK